MRPTTEFSHPRDPLIGSGKRTENQLPYSRMHFRSNRPLMCWINTELYYQDWLYESLKNIFMLALGWNITFLLMVLSWFGTALNGATFVGANSLGSGYTYEIRHSTTIKEYKLCNENNWNLNDGQITTDGINRPSLWQKKSRWCCCHRRCCFVLFSLLFLCFLLLVSLFVFLFRIKRRFYRYVLMTSEIFHSLYCLG